MSEEKKEHKTLAQIQGSNNNVSNDKSADVVSSSVNSSGEDVKIQGDANVSQSSEGQKTDPNVKFENEVQISELSNNISSQDKLVAKLPEIDPNPMAKLVEEKMALKIEQKIEAHLQKEISLSTKKDFIKIFIYIVGITLFLVWIVWTVTLIWGMSK